MHGTASDSASIGQSRKRREDEALISGRGRYVADIVPDRCLHASFLRSPFARGKLVRLDTKPAMALPGTVAVFTAAQFAAMPPHPVNTVIAGSQLPHSPILAGGDIHSAGQPLAMVVAHSAAAALDAIEAIECDIESREPVLAPETARSAPRLNSAMSDNLVASDERCTGDVEEAFEAAAVIVEAECRHPRLFPAPLESRAILADWDDATGRLVVHSSTQTPHRARSDLARLLGLPTDKVHVVAPDVGGAFGGKASICAEDVAVAYAAKDLRRCVHWVAQRSEDFLAAAQGRGASSYGSLALDRNGRMLGLKANLLFPLGWWVPFSGLVPAWNAGRVLPGPYDIPVLHTRVEIVLTNSPPVGIYRGAGRPEATMLLESLVDKAARTMALRPADLRRRNLRAPATLPAKLPDGGLLDAGDYPRIMDLAESLAAENAPPQRSNKTTLRGRGQAMFIEPCGQGWESARLTLEPDGKITLATGSTSQGQGRETAFAQIAAQALSRHEDDIIVVHGNTDLTPVGIGALASRSTAIGGSAVFKCADQLSGKISEAATKLLACQADDVVPNPAGVYDRNHPHKIVPWPELASSVNHALTAETDYRVDHEAWSYGCCMADVEIDRDTGRLRITRLVFCDDAGRAVNPMLIKGQIHGGIAQGLGEACLESVVTDDDGQLLSGSLMDYALPRADDMPTIVTAKIETPSLFNTLGARGVGEAGTIGTQPAILNAVRDALKDYAFENLEMPLTSEKLWRIMQNPQAKA
jgi:carbon-monoxide dehydrogenase large subunit